MMNEQPHNHLYEVSIEQLGLSEDAKKPLLRTGIETVGDVIDLMIRLNDLPGACDGFPRGLYQVIDEIRECLNKHGYEKYYRS